MKSSTKLFAAMTALASLSAASAVSAQIGNQSENAPRFDDTQREAIEQTIEDGNYEAWKAIISEKDTEAKILDVINADNFDRLQDLHEARDEGNREAAKEIADELGLKPPRGEHGRGHGPDEETREAIQAAVESGDFEAFKEIVSADERGGKILETVNADNFDRFQALHDARESGDREAAEAIANELGLERPQRGGHGDCEHKGERGERFEEGERGGDEHVEFEREEDEDGDDDRRERGPRGQRRGQGGPQGGQAGPGNGGEGR